VSRAEGIPEAIGGVARGVGKAAAEFVTSIPGQVREFYEQGAQPPIVPGELPETTAARAAGYQGAARTIAGYTPLKTSIGVVLPAMAAQGGAEILRAGAPTETPAGPRPPSAGEVGERLGGGAVGLAMGVPGLIHAAVKRAPSQAETAAAVKNVTPPAAMPQHVRRASTQASTELGAAIGEIQGIAEGPVPFRGAGLSIEDAHVIPNLTRVFPGDANPVRVTVYDQATGELHSVQLPSIAALKDAMLRPLPAELSAPRAAELPGPRIQPRQGVPSEAIAQGLERSKEARARGIAQVGQQVAANVPTAVERIQSAPKAIAALERQIAESPNDARVGRWRRRIEKLKALPKPEAPRVVKAAVAEQPAKVKGEARVVASREAAPPPTPKVVAEAEAGVAEPVAATGKAARAKPGEPTAPAPPPVGEPQPAEAPKGVPGRLQRGDRVRAAAGANKGEHGFVISSSKSDPTLLMVRWDHGRQSVEQAKDLRFRTGRATEAEIRSLEAVEEPATPYRQARSYAPGKEPPARPAVEAVVAAAVRRRAGLRPHEELALKPSTFRSEYSSSNEEFVTDGHVLYMAQSMEPKLRAKLHEKAKNRTVETSPKIDQVVAKATKGPMAKLEPRGWMPTAVEHRGEQDLAAFHDPKSGRLVAVDAQKWKLSIKAVAPDSYEQATATPLGAIVMRREGKFVGLMMPVKATEAQAAELVGTLGAKVVRHEARAGGAPSTAKAAPAGKRGIPVARTAPHVPTEAESKTLPTIEVPGGKAAPVPKTSPLGHVREVMHELVALTNPVRFAVGPNLDVLMRSKGTLKRALFRSERAQKSVRSYWEKRSKPQVLDFLTRFESGAQADPRLQEIADAYRKRADNMFKAISRYKEIPYWENWFPHAWSDPAKARQFFAARRPMEGRKSFLKKRFFEDTLAGMKAGLEPVSWNPEELMQAAEHNARKYVMVQEMIKEYKALGSMKLVRIGQEAPEGFRRVDQNWARLYLNPEIEIKEAFDRKIMEGLTGVARSLGIRLERKVRIGGKMLGFSESAPGQVGRVTTRFATPESVLAHEIGHQIDSKYDLANLFLGEPAATGKGSGKLNAERIEMKKELQRLADLRFEGGTPAPHYKAYVRSAPEKMAVMLEALIHAPERFKEVAPKNYARLITFLSLHDELRPLVHIRPSLLYGEATGTVSAGGVVLGGEYWAEQNLARLLDNHMSRDWIRESKLGRGVMDSRNTLNAINLGLSAFHATGVTLLSVMSRMGIGFSELAHGQLATGAGKIVTAPFAPLAYVKAGWDFYKGAPELIDFEKRLFTAGASLESKQYYKNEMFDRFVRNSRQVFAEGGTPYQRAGGAAKAIAQAPFAALESSMRLLSNYVIPQMKVGAFRDLEASQLRIKSKDIAAGKDTVENVGRIAWRDVEDRFGLINYDNEFWNNTLKASIMVLIRAPGWSLGTVRALGGAAFADLPRFAARAVTGKAPEWTSRMSFALSMVFTTMAASAIYHYLHTGKPPKELEDYLHPKNGLRDKKGHWQRVNFPTFMKDVEGWSTDPVKEAVGRVNQGRGASALFHGGKLAPEVTLAIDLLENQSYKGPIWNINDPFLTGPKGGFGQAGQVARYIFGHEQPFSIQQAKRTLGERGGAQAAESFFGVTPYYPRAPKRKFHYREQTQ
jgi:hypothetical protein